MILKYKKLCPEAKAPVKAHPTDAGFDLSPVKVIVKGRKVVCSFGLAIEIPDGYAGLIFPRSSIHKTQWRMSNSIGLIDSCFRGELRSVFDIKDAVELGIWGLGPSIWEKVVTEEPIGYKPGERCCQLVIVPIPEVSLQEVEELSPSDRGEGGFGSTGK